MLTGKINKSVLLFFIILILAVPLFSYGAGKIMPDGNGKSAERYYYTNATAQAGKKKKYVSSSPIELTPSNRQGIEMKYQFSGPKIKKVDEEYFSIEVADTYTFWEEPGLPLLPVKAAKILIPQDCDVKNISVSQGKKITLDGEFRIEYSRQQIPMSRPDLKVKTEPNRDIYDSPAPFPGKFYSEISTQFLRGYKILILNLYPVQYKPMYGEISYYPDMKLIVTTTPAKPVPGYRKARCRNKPHDRALIRRAIDNPSLIDTYIEEERTGEDGGGASGEDEGALALPAEDPGATPLTLTGGPYEYVIITTEALESTFQILAAHKVSKGLTATVVTVDGAGGIYAVYSGVDNQTKIRNFIYDSYNTWGTEYVVLGGDGDGDGGAVIPHRGVYGYVATSPSVTVDSDIPCDLYYSALEGTWDNDLDGIYGESNDGVGGYEVDLMAEVCIGRIACDTSTEAANQINKIIAYENSTPGKSALLVGEQLNPSPLTWGGDYKDEVYTYFPGAWSTTTLYERDSTFNRDYVVGAMNSNQYHIVNHMGHANNTDNMGLDPSDVDGLSNTTYFLAYSQGCYANAFDNRKSNLTYTVDAISEHFTVENGSGAAFAYIGNTRYGWYTPGSTDGASQQFDKEFFDTIFNESKTHLGIAFEDSRQDLIAWVFPTGAMRWCFFELCLMGDPETPITSVLPDLTLAEPDISFSNPTPPPGETITISALIHNNGEDYSDPELFLAQESDTGVGYLIYTGLWGAQSFLVGSQNIKVSKISLFLWRRYSSAGQVNIEIQTDSGGSPSGTKIGTESNSNTISSGKWWEFTFITEPVLTKNTKYWIVAKSTSPDTAKSGWLLDVTNPYADGEEKVYDGVWWNTGYDATFRIYDGMGLAAISFYDGDPDASGMLIDTDYLSPISASSSDTASVQWTVTAGTHDIWVVIDPDNYLTESNENNNKKNKAITGETVLSLLALPTGWHVTMGVGEEKVMSPGEKIGIWNTGNVNETFNLQVINTGGTWSAATTENGNTANTFVINGLFTSTALGSIVGADFNQATNDDVIRSDIAKTASATIFGCTASAENGANVPPVSGPTTSRTLWLQFKSPTETNTYQPQDIVITIGAQSAL